MNKPFPATKDAPAKTEQKQNDCFFKNDFMWQRNNARASKGLSEKINKQTLLQVHGQNHFLQTTHLINKHI